MPDAAHDLFAPLPDGRRTCFRLEGDPDAGEGDVVVLIAGLGEDLTSWQAEFVAPLVAAGLRVLRFDNRDCGRSSYIDAPAPAIWRQAAQRPRPDGYALDDMADDVVALLDHLGIDSAHLVGRSMGGMIAQTLAARRPDRVRSLTSLYSTTGQRGVGGYTLGTMLRMAAPAPRTREDAVAAHVAMTRHIAGPGYPVDEAREAAAAAAAWDRRGGDVAAGTARQVQAIQRSGDRTAQVRSIAAPTLVVHGDHDPLVAPSGGHATARAVTGSVHVEVPGMGHHLHPALAPAVAAMVLDLVAGRPVAVPAALRSTPPPSDPAPSTSSENPMSTTGTTGTIDVAATRVIPAPVARVWELTGDPRRNPEWVGNVKSVPRALGPYAIGESFEEVSVVVGPWTSRTVWTCVAIEPLRERRMVGQGFPGVGEIRPYLRYEPVVGPGGAEHCRMTYGALLRLRWPRTAPVAGPLLRSMVTAEFAGSLENLERLLAAEAGVARLGVSV